MRHGKHGQWAPVPAPAPRSTYYDGTYGGQLTGSGSTSWQLGGFFAGSDFEFTVAGSAIDLSGEGKIGVLDVSKGVAAVRFATRPDNRLSVTSPLPPAVVGSVHDCSGTIQFSSAKAATGSFTCTLELTNSETIQVTSSPTSVAFEAKRIR